MNFLQFSKTIKTEIKPVYIFKGEDDFLIEKCISLLSKACGIEQKELDFQKFDSENFDVAKCLNSCEQMPFSARFRIVVIKNLTKLTESDKTKLKSYCQNPSPSTIIAFVAFNGFEEFSFIKNAEVVLCSKLDVVYLKKYIIDELTKLNRSISEKALATLIDYTNSNLTKISSEIIKLASSVEDGELIKGEQVDDLVTKDTEYQIYELAEDIAKQKLDEALFIIDDMLSKKEEPAMLCSLISSYFRRMFHCAVSAYSDSEMASMLGVKEGAIYIARQKSKNFSVVQLKNILDKCCNVEYMIKSGEMPSDIAIYYLLYSIVAIIA